MPFSATANFHIVVIGEILFDIYPDLDWQQVGGAPFNFAFHLYALGNTVTFISRIGADAVGEKILSKLKKQGFPCENIQVDQLHATGKVVMQQNRRCQGGGNQPGSLAYEHISWPPIERWWQCYCQANPTATIDMLYFGTLCQRGQYSRNTIARLLANSAPHRKFCDLNLLRPVCHEHFVRQFLSNCDILKLNAEELPLLQDMFALKRDPEQTLRQLQDLFSLEHVCLTTGATGSMLLTGDRLYTHRIQNPEPIINSTGAGDAYSALLCLGILQNWPPREILDKCSRLALAICQLKGTVPGNIEFYGKNFDLYG